MKTFVGCLMFLLYSSTLASSLGPDDGDHKLSYTSVGNGLPNTFGTEFVFNFPQPARTTTPPAVLVSTESVSIVSVNVSVPGLGFHLQTTVERTQYSSIELPREVYLDPVSYPQDKTVVVTSDEDVSVYGTTSVIDDGDAFMVYPTHTLGKEYLILTYRPYSSTYPSEFSIAALQDNTNIQITLESVSFGITLNKYESYQEYDGYQDLSGSIVEADKPVAVMAGAELTPMGTNNCGIMEQLPSIDNFGRHFVLAPFKDRLYGYVYRVICPAGDDACTLLINDVNHNVNAGEIYEVDVVSNIVTVITSDRPVLVAQFMKDISSDSRGGGAMVIVPPVEMFSGNIVFPVLDIQLSSSQYYINIIAKCSDGNELLYDNTQDVIDFDTVSHGDMCAYRSQVTSGMHSVTHTDPSVTFAVIVYGYQGTIIGFIYLAGYSPIPDGQVRLVDGSDMYEGRVEILHNGDWGTVCDDLWDIPDGDVVCRQLGYVQALTVYGGAHFGAGEGRILLDDVGCDGDELTLGSCFHLGWGTHNCDHSQDAGVRCWEPIPDVEVRLVGGSDIYEGRVEVYNEGEWGTVCDDYWDIPDGDVVCRQLGYGQVLKVYGNAYFGQGSGPILLDNVDCTGQESTIGSCPHNGWGISNCYHSEDASVRCSEPIPEGELRLVDGNNIYEGRVEIFHGGEWGTVCDNSWDILDGDVVCRQLGYDYATKVHEFAYFGEGSGPILLENVECTGQELTLASCPHKGWGNHECFHSEDAGVTCLDPNPDQPGTFGTEFVFNFPRAFIDYEPPTVILSTLSINSVAVNVSVSGLGFNSQTTVDRTKQVEIELPMQTYLDLINNVQEKVVVVTSDEDISVHGVTSRAYYGDGFMAFPTPTLGKKYLILTYGPYNSNYPSEFSIAALNDNTHVHITYTFTPQPLEIILDKYQSYQAFDGYDDLTGCVVEADKPIAVMAGAELVALPSYHSGILVQLPSFDNFGTEFVLAPFQNRIYGYIYRVICPTDVTISINGVPKSLAAGIMYEGDVASDTVTVIISDIPVEVAQFMKGYGSDGRGGSAMVIVPPVEMFSGNIVFPVYNDGPINTYINVIAQCSDGHGLRYDDTQDVSDFDTVSYDGMCAYRSKVEAGIHSVTHVDSDVTFAVIVYGYYSSYDGYIYVAGYSPIFDSSMISTTPNIDITAKPDCENNMMVVYIPKTELGDMSAEQLSFIDDSCVSEDFNATHYRLTSAFDECGTTAEVQNGYIVLSNVIMKDVYHDSNLNRDHRIEIPIQCYMSQNGQGKLSFHPETSKIVYHEEEFGEFSFQLQLYPNSAYLNPHPSNAYPLQVNLKEKLYIEARADAQNSLQLFVDSCVATLSTNPYSNPRFEFINNGCSSDDALEFNPSGESLIQRFSLDSLDDIDLDRPMYVHCFVMLCDASDTSSRCSPRDCQSTTKRDGSGSKLYLVTQGPLIREREDNHAVGSTDPKQYPLMPESKTDSD